MKKYIKNDLKLMTTCFRSYQGCIIEDAMKLVVEVCPTTDRCSFKVKVFSPGRSDQQQDDLHVDDLVSCPDPTWTSPRKVWVQD